MYIMTKEDVQTTYSEIIEKMHQGKMMEVFETYYHEDVVMQDRGMEACEGKDANREREETFLSKVTEFRGMQCLEAMYQEDLAISLWYNDFSHHDYGDVQGRQLSITKFQDGKIISEEFMYV